MSLNIVVIGRGEQHQTRLPNDHLLTFRGSASLAGGFLALDPYDFVFQHTGNREAQFAIDAWRATGSAAKIIGVTAGTLAPAWFEDLGLPILKNISNARDVLQLPWRGVDKQFTGPSEQLADVLSAHLNLLPAALMLCKGYLAVHAVASEKNADCFIDQLEPALREMRWYESPVPDDVRVSLANRVRDVRDPRWWLKPFGLWDSSAEKRMVENSRWNSFAHDVLQEWKLRCSGELDPDFAALYLEVLRFGDAVEPPSLVAKAYCGLVNALG